MGAFVSRHLIKRELKFKLAIISIVSRTGKKTTKNHKFPCLIWTTESLDTSWKVATEWTLARVDPQVLGEI